MDGLASLGGRHRVYGFQARRDWSDPFGLLPSMPTMASGATRSAGAVWGPYIGSTATPAVAWAYQRLEKSFANAVRIAQPDEVAALISWPSSDEASNVNGAVISADGGWMA